jgi:hypothetical protein
VFQAGALTSGISICHEGSHYPETVRVAENTCIFATVNYANDGAPTTLAIVRPDGTLLSFQPYGQLGLLTADIDLSEAPRLLATRCKDGGGA